jgi:hypothetical protein
MRVTFKNVSESFTNEIKWLFMGLDDGYLSECNLKIEVAHYDEEAGADVFEVSFNIINDDMVKITTFATRITSPQNINDYIWCENDAEHCEFTDVHFEIC